MMPGSDIQQTLSSTHNLNLILTIKAAIETLATFASCAPLSSSDVRQCPNLEGRGREARRLPPLVIIIEFRKRG